MGRVRPEEATAVGAELLDDHFDCHRAAGDGLHRALKRMDHRRAVEGHRQPAQDQQRRADRGDRQDHQKRGAAHIQIEVVPLPGAAEPARRGGDRRQPGRRRHELQPHDAEKLREVRQRAFAGVVLQIGVGHERGDGVEDQAALDRFLPVRVQRQELLERQHAGHDHEHDRVEDQEADRVLFPVLVGFGGSPDHFMEEAFHFPMRGAHEIGGRAHHLEHPFPERQRNQDRQPENGNCE